MPACGALEREQEGIASDALPMVYRGAREEVTAELHELPTLEKLQPTSSGQNQ